MSFPNYYQYITVGKNKENIPFTNTDIPSIPDYSIYAAKYGQYPNMPNAKIYYVNESGNIQKHSAEPEFVLDSSDLIESINFGPLSDPITGFILLQ